MGGGDGKVTPEQNSFGKQLIVLQLMGSSQQWIVADLSSQQ